MWSYLEPLFIHSDEVKKELPLDTKRFEKIDGEVKATLAELWIVKKVRFAARNNLGVKHDGTASMFSYNVKVRTVLQV